MGQYMELIRDLKQAKEAAAEEERRKQKEMEAAIKLQAETVSKLFREGLTTKLTDLVADLNASAVAARLSSDNSMGIPTRTVEVDRDNGANLQFILVQEDHKTSIAFKWLVEHSRKQAEVDPLEIDRLEIIIREFLMALLKH
jgi:hypothetical protein